MALRKKDKPPPEIPLTSTADVAFLLLIFFLVAASTSNDTGRPLDLPAAQKSTQTKTEQGLEIIVKPKIIAVAGEPLNNDAELLPALRKRLEGKTDANQRIVLLVADGAVDYQRWSNVITAIETAGGIPVPQLEEDESAIAGGAKADAPAEGPK